jgi:hypothetical protein
MVRVDIDQDLYELLTMLIQPGDESVHDVIKRTAFKAALAHVAGHGYDNPVLTPEGRELLGREVYGSKFV